MLNLNAKMAIFGDKCDYLAASWTVRRKIENCAVSTPSDSTSAGPFAGGYDLSKSAIHYSVNLTERPIT